MKVPRKVPLGARVVGSFALIGFFTLVYIYFDEENISQSEKGGGQILFKEDKNLPPPAPAPLRPSRRRNMTVGLGLFLTSVTEQYRSQVGMLSQQLRQLQDQASQVEQQMHLLTAKPIETVFEPPRRRRAQSHHGDQNSSKPVVHMARYEHELEIYRSYNEVRKQLRDRIASQSYGQTSEPFVVRTGPFQGTILFPKATFPVWVQVNKMPLRVNQMTRIQRLTITTFPDYVAPDIRKTSTPPSTRGPFDPTGKIGCRSLQTVLDEKYNCTCTLEDCLCFNDAHQIYPYGTEKMTLKEFQEHQFPDWFPLLWDMNGVYDGIMDHSCSAKLEIGCSLWNNPEMIQDGDILYVDLLNMDDFVRLFLPRVPPGRQFHLFSAGRAQNLYPPTFTQQDKMLNSDHLLMWWSPNANYSHPKVKPIGVGVHMRYRATLLGMMGQRGKGADPPKGLSYSSFFISAPGSCRFPPEFNFNKDTRLYAWNLTGHCFRRYIVEILHTRKLGKIDFTRVKPVEMYKSYLAHEVVVSPPGLGIDAHRTYEALFMGRVPLVSNLPPMMELYRDLPVLVVEDWSKLSADFVHNGLRELGEKSYRLQSLSQVHQYVEMWKTCVASARDRGALL